MSPRIWRSCTASPQGEAGTCSTTAAINIYTTLDPEIQEIAESVYEDRGSLNNLTSANGQLIHSGITIIEPYTGNIVAMVGDMGEKTGNLLWNYATDIQQPGSSIKPLTAYAPALDAGASLPRPPPLTTTRSAC